MLTRLWKNNRITLVMNMTRQVREKVKTDGTENRPLCTSVQENGEVIFRFPRLFFVARR